MDNKLLSYIGICQKAGVLVSGAESCLKAISSGKAYVIIVSSDASDNTKKRFSDKSQYYKVPVFFTGTRDELSAAAGKTNRPVMVVSDKGLSEKIIELLEKERESV